MTDPFAAIDCILADHAPDVREPLDIAVAQIKRAIEMQCENIEFLQKQNAEMHQLIAQLVIGLVQANQWILSSEQQREQLWTRVGTRSPN